jgi:hypothetical protein
LTNGGNRAQLDWEARFARPAAAAAVGSAVLTIVAIAIQISAFKDLPNNDKSRLIAAHDKSSDLWISIALRDVALVLLALVLWYLFKATKHRTALPGIVAPLIPLAPILLVAASILNQLEVIQAANDFLGSADQSNKHAKDLLKGISPVGAALGAGGTLALALSIVMVNLNAMRAGLLSRFMGVIGIITGALFVIPLAPVPIVQMFWLGALAALFVGRWPGGRGPAWDSGEAVPWPSAAEQREQTVGDRLRSGGGGGRPPRGKPARAPEPSPAETSGSDEGGEGVGPATPHPVSKKRKRKRRH